MTLLLFSARPDLEANSRLVAAGQSLGVTVRTIDANVAVVRRTGETIGLFVGGEDVFHPRPEAVIARIGNWRPETLLAMVEAAESLGIPTPNPAAAIRAGRDHWRTIESLAEAGLPVPRSLVGMDPERTARAAADTFGFPVVVKLRRSRMGIGVIACAGLDHLESVLDSLWRVGDEFVVQEYVDTGGTSIRVLVADGETVASARFRARRGEWRSNAARGGAADACNLGDEEAETAVGAARTLGLGVCGVDLLPTPGGCIVCEVNPTPGFRRLESVTEVDVAAAIVRAAVAAAEGH